MAQPTTFGATIVPSDSPHEREQLRPFNDSPALTPAVSHDTSAQEFYLEQTPSIQSPFYQHPPASHEVIALHNQTPNRPGKLNVVSVYEKDLESGNATPLTANGDENPFSKSHCVRNNKEDTMWPSKLTLKQQKQAVKKERREKRGVRGCAPLRNRWSKMCKRDRILVQIATAFVIIGIAVALGVGISTAVRGTYYVSEGSSQTVGE